MILEIRPNRSELRMPQANGKETSAALDLMKLFFFLSGPQIPLHFSL